MYLCTSTYSNNNNGKDFECGGHTGEVQVRVAHRELSKERGWWKVV